MTVEPAQAMCAAAEPSAPPSRRRLGEVGLAFAAAGTGLYLLIGLHGALLLLIGLLAVSYVGFGMVLWAGRQEGALDRRRVLWVAGVLLALALVAAPIESQDVWSYASYGRMVSHYHESPFNHVPSDYPADPIMGRVVRAWQHTPSVYGPVFIATAVPGMWVAGDSPLMARLYFQVLALLAVAAAMWLVDHHTSGSPLALALIGVNPFIVISVVNGAHNDALVGLTVLGAVLLAQRGHWRLCALVLAMGIAIKVAAGLCVLGVAVWVWRWKGWRPAVRLVVWCGLITGGLYLLGGGMVALEPLRNASSQISGGSMWRMLRAPLTSVHRSSGISAGEAAEMATRQLTLVANALALALAGLLIFRSRTKPNLAVVVGLAVFAYGIIGAYVYPWYLAWGLVPLALAWRSRSTVAMALFAGVLHLGFVPDPRSVRLDRPIQGAARSLQKSYIHWWVPVLEILAVIVAIAWTSTETRKRMLQRWPRLVAFSGGHADRP